MIKINLLPERYRPKGKNPLPYIFVALFALGVLMGIGWSFLSLSGQKSSLLKEIQATDSQLQSLSEVVNAVKQLEQEENLLAVQEKTIEEITAGRVIWAMQLYLLANLVSDGIWLDEITMSTKQRPVTKEVSRPDPRDPAKFTTITQTTMESFPALLISGYALSPVGEEGVERVGQLIRNLETDAQFSSTFSRPEMRSIEREMIEKTTVMRFKMDCEILSQ